MFRDDLPDHFKDILGHGVRLPGEIGLSGENGLGRLFLVRASFVSVRGWDEFVD